MAIFAGGTPIGAPLVGWVANVAGPRWALGVAAISGLSAAAVAIVWMIVARNLRLHRDPDARLRVRVGYDHKRHVGPKRTFPEDLATQEIAIQRG